MTVPLSIESPRRAAAREFARELRRAKLARQVGTNALAAAAGVGRTAIANYLAAGNLPRLETAIILADSLSWPRLVEIVQSVRMARCQRPGCDREYVNEGGNRKAYCSARCLELNRKIVAGAGTPRARAAIAESILAAHVAAVGAMCRQCEPEGLCRDDTCVLRPVSPLPTSLRRQGEPRLAVKPDGRWGGSEAARAAQLEAQSKLMKEKWATADERRRKQRERSKAMWADPEQRARMQAAISAARRTPDDVDRARQRTAETWKDPAVRERRIAGMRRARAAREAS